MELSSEEILTASTVNQSLFDTQGSSALEDYFLDKSLRGWWLSIAVVTVEQVVIKRLQLLNCL